MNLTGQQVVTRALRVAKVLGADESPSTFELNEGLSALQQMLDRWWADPQLHYSPTYLLPWFPDLATVVSVPTGLSSPVIYSLAALIAPEHGQTLDPRLLIEARNGLQRRRAYIAAMQVPNMVHETVLISDEYASDAYDIEEA